MTIDELLTRGVSEVLPSKKGLADLLSKKKITLYQGFDPSMPSLHLGNLVGLIKLRQFQKLGHKIIFLVGDFTGMIGDPTDKLSTRKKLTRKQVLKNAETWKEQAGKVLDFEGNNPAKIMFNSKWLDKVTFKDLIEITSNLTVQQMIERDMFQERLKKEKPIHLHEFLYPVAQGLDSVKMNVDLEIGGNDQVFNMMVGRTLMKALKDKEKFVLTTKLLVDKKGQKVGKTTGNALFLDSSPEEFFSGVMSFPDETILLGFELLTEADLREAKEQIKTNPMMAKKRLAFEVVKLLWGENKAKKAQEYFEKKFQKRKVTDDLASIVKIGEDITIADLVTLKIGSKSEAKRLIDQKAVDINGETRTNPKHPIKGGELVKIGKRIIVKVKKN